MHRDVKPENILCGASIEDIKMADFGLSKMHLPHEKLDTTCGTLSYIAPEVLQEQGYGQEVITIILISPPYTRHATAYINNTYYRIQ